jgi:hypothetical protein
VHQPARHYQQGSQRANPGVGWRHRNRQRADRHQRERENQPFAAPMTVQITAQCDGAQRPHQKPGPEGRKESINERNSLPLGKYVFAIEAA